MSTGKIIDVGLSLDQEYIKASVENIVKAGIVQALGDPSVLVRDAINQTINRKVDREGKPSDRDYYAIPYLNWLANKVVEDTIRQALTEAVQANADSLREEMLRQLSSKNFKRDLASAFLQSVLNASESTWRMPVTINFEPPKD